MLGLQWFKVVEISQKAKLILFLDFSVYYKFFLYEAEILILIYILNR